MRAPADAPCVLHVDPEEGFSGGETQVEALIAHQRAHGIALALACPPGAELGRRVASLGVALRPLRCRLSHDPRAGLALRWLVESEGFDVVHLHTSRALSLAPYLPRATARVVTRRMDYPPRGAAAYVRWLYRCVDAVIAISPAVRAALLARGVPASTIEVVPSGVDVARFADLDRAEARRVLAVDPEEDVVAIIASLHERKGHAVLLAALARLDATGAGVPLCLVAGAGPERAALAESAQHLGIAARVRWLGRVADVRSVLAAADLVVVPSLAEGLGVAALEALAGRRPVIASRVGGLADVIRSEVDGLLVPPGDPAALAAAVARCLDDRGLRERLAAGGAARAAGYSAAAMARGTWAVYERALAARRGGRVGEGIASA